MKDVDDRARGPITTLGPDSAGPDSAGPDSAGPDSAGLAAELLTAIGAVRRAARRAARNASVTEPLPPARSELLRLTARQPGITVAEAARELRLAPNTVSTMVGHLTAQGLVSRGRSSADGRTVRLNATARARQRLAQWRDLRAEQTGQALAGLTGEDREVLAAAIPALVRLAEQVDNAEVGAPPRLREES